MTKPELAKRLIGKPSVLTESAKNYLAAIIAASDDAIISKDLNGIITLDGRGGIELPASESTLSPSFAEAPSRSQFRYSETENAASLAAGLFKSKDARHPEAIERLAWSALLEDKVGIAYHLVRALEQSRPPERVELLSSLRALALGREFQNPLGSIAEQLREDFGLIATSSDSYSSADSAGHRLLLIASGLRAAV